MKKQTTFVPFPLLSCCPNIHKTHPGFRISNHKHAYTKQKSQWATRSRYSLGTPSHRKADSLLLPLHNCMKCQPCCQGEVHKGDLGSQFPALTPSPTNVCQPLTSTTAEAGSRKLSSQVKQWISKRHVISRQAGASLFPYHQYRGAGGTNHPCHRVPGSPLPPPPSAPLSISSSSSRTS